MTLCGLCNIFNKKPDFRKMIDEFESRNIILNELNTKVEIAEADYKKNNNSDNMIKCINAINMRNKYLQNNNIQDNNKKINFDDDVDLT